MKSKLLVLALISLTSVSSAVGLMGTKASFAEGSFCKKYSCNALSSMKSPDGSGSTIYGYAIPTAPNVLLVIKRNSNRVIEGAQFGIHGDPDSLKNSAKLQKLLSEFGKYIMGIDTTATCLNAIRDYDNEVFVDPSVRVAAAKYKGNGNIPCLVADEGQFVGQGLMMQFK